MKKQTLFSLFLVIATTIVVSGCKDKTPDPTHDESSYIGTYYGNHYLADSFTISGLVEDPTATMIYADTFIVSNGTSTTDGKLSVKSSLLSANPIEVNIANNAITPVNMGNVSILGTTIKYTKINTGSTATWNDAKSLINTHLNVSATFNYDGTDIPLNGITINGKFEKQ